MKHNHTIVHYFYSFLGEGIHVFSDLLRTNTNPQFLTIVCACLDYAIRGNNEAKKLLLNQNGTAHMMEALDKAKHENLIETALKVFQGLAVSPDNKKFINSRFGIELLVKFIRPDVQDSRKKNLQSYYAASAVRNLSDSAKQIQDPRRLAEMMLVPIQQQSMQVSFQLPQKLSYDATLKTGSWVSQGKYIFTLNSLS